MYVYANIDINVNFWFLFFCVTPLECKLCLEILVIDLQLLCYVRLYNSMNCSMPASLSSTISLSSLKLMSVESLMPSNHLILCHLLLLLPSIIPSIRAFFKESALHIRWPKYWNFSFSTDPSNEYSGLISFRTDLFDLLEILEWCPKSRVPQNIS